MRGFPRGVRIARTGTEGVVPLMSSHQALLDSDPAGFPRKKPVVFLDPTEPEGILVKSPEGLTFLTCLASWQEEGGDVASVHIKELVVGQPVRVGGPASTTLLIRTCESVWEVDVGPKDPQDVHPSRYKQKLGAKVLRGEPPGWLVRQAEKQEALEEEERDGQEEARARRASLRVPRVQGNVPEGVVSPSGSTAEGADRGPRGRG